MNLGAVARRGQNCEWVFSLGVAVSGRAMGGLSRNKRKNRTLLRQVLWVVSENGFMKHAKAGKRRESSGKG